MGRISVTSGVATALAAAFLAPCALADETPSGGLDVFQFGVRAVYLEPSNPVVTGPVGNMSGKMYAEFSADWRLGRRWSTEVTVGLPTDFNLPDGGGGVRLMPFTWTAKYHFLIESRFRPYLGVGAHYTRATLTNVPQGFANGQDTAGFVAQAGADLRAGSTWSVNADIRRLFGLEPSDTRINPFLYSLGITFHY